VTVIGVGTQQGLSEAEAFAENFGPFTFPMVWDSSGESWSRLGIAGQPAVALFDANGVLVETWYGGVDRALPILESMSKA
jgi:hypothetical protein